MLIVFDGIDGSGKTSQIDRTVSYLRQKRGPSEVVVNKEPGTTKLGLAIREILYEKVPMKDLAPGVIDLLFLASHIQNWKTVVMPAILDGKFVVSDRFWYSQEAYGTQRVIPPPISRAYEKCRGMHADLLIFLHGDVKVLVDRANARTSETHQKAKTWNDYQTLSDIQGAFFNKFAHLKEWRPISVDGKNPDQVWEEVRAILDVEI